MMKTRLTALCIALSFAGCSSFNPYQRSRATDNDVIVGLKADELARAGLFVGGLHEALDAANAQRVEYFESLSAHARGANVATALVFAFTGWGLYQGLKPGTSGDSRLLAKAGVGAGTTYAVGNYFLNEKHDEAYIEGFKALTCAMLRSQPLMLGTAPALPATPWAAASAPASAASAPSLASQEQQLRAAVENLRSQVNTLDTEVLKHRYMNDIDPSARNKNLAQRTLAAARSAQRDGRKTLVNAERLLNAIEQSGFQLRRQVDLIVASVSEELRRNNKGVGDPAKLLTELKSVSSGFQAIPPAPRTEDDDASDDKPATGAGGTNGDTPAAASSTAETAAKAPGDAAKSNAVATALADLSKAVESLKAEVRDPKLAKAGATADAKKQADERIRRLKGEITQLDAALKKAKDDANPRNTLADKVRGDLAAQIATLYAVRRPVNQFLANHYDIHRRVRGIPECRVGGSESFTLVPNEDTAAARGGTYTFRIAGAKGLPSVSLDGDLGSIEAQALAVTVEGGVVVARFTVGKNAPEGVLRLVVIDPATKAHEDVALTLPKAGSK